MIDDLKAIAIFAEMAKQGSFRGAARVLGLSPSVVSYHVSQLEKRIGTALIYRSTRKLSLTHEGERLYQHAQVMLSAAAQGLSEVTVEGDEPSGHLKLTLPSLLTRAPLNARLAAFSQRYPQIELELLYTDTRQDLIADGIDLAVRAGKLEDSALKARRIGEIERKLVCSPAYLQSHTMPVSPEDLADWDWIRLSMLPPRRTLLGPKGEQAVVTFSSHVSVDAVEAMQQFAVLGLGVATPPAFLVDSEIQAGRLVQPLPEWRVEAIPLYAVWPQNAALNRNLSLLLEYLIPTTEC